MAKFFEVTSENDEMIMDIFEETGMYKYMNIKIVGVAKAKELIKISKANPLAEYVGKCPDTIVLTLYEEAFERLDDKTKKILLTDEKDKINIGAPQIVVTVGGRMKYGDELINAAEVGVLAIQQLEEERKEKKEMEKANKKKS